MPKTSLIIPTFDRQKITFDTLVYLNNQTIKDFEVIVIDQTKSVSKDLDNFSFSNGITKYKYFNIDKVGLPNARNVGAQHAVSKILIYLDDDCIPENKLIESYINIFNKQDSKVWCIGGRVIEKGSSIMRQSDKILGGWVTWYGKTLKNFDSNETGLCQWAPGGNFAVKADKFSTVGGFDENYLGNAILEDGDFGFNIINQGGYVMYSPKPVMEHLRAQLGGTRKESASKGMFYRAHNTIYFLRKHKMRLRIFPALWYLLGVAVKDLIQGKHGFTAIFWTKIGFIKGFFTKPQ